MKAGWAGGPMNEPAGAGDVIGVDDRVEPSGAVVPADAFAHIASVAVVVTDLSGRVTFWNPAAEEWFGWSWRQTHGHSVAEVTGSEWWPTAQSERAASVMAGRVWVGELTARSRAGTDVAASVLQTGLFSPARELTGVVHLVTGPPGQARGGPDLGSEPFQTVVEGCGLGLGLVDLDGTLRYANPQLADMTGWPAETLAGSSLLHLLDPPGQQAVRAAMARRRAGVTDDYMLQCRRGDRDLRHLHVHGVPVRAPDGTVTGSVIVVADETERRRVEAELNRLALHDPLTGLPNRATLHDRLAQALARRQRHDSVLAVLFVDLDRFKTVNDRLGHAAGDAVLQTVAGRLVGALRPGDTVARLGGDEFVVVCEDLPGSAEAAQVARRLGVALAPPLPVDDAELLLGASIGVVVVATSDWQVDPTELLHEADLAMYHAKSRGGSRHEVVTDPARSARDGPTRAGALRAALDREEFVVFYQPRVELPRLGAVGAEALVRWRHPRRGLLGPDAFLSAADRNGLINPVGQWVLRTACRDAATWPETAAGRGPSVSVNLSARQLFDPEIIAAVARVLTDTGLDPARLTLEMSETTLMGRAQDSLSVLSDLKTLGVRLAIDDVGSGSSSLPFFQRFPLDEVTIDRSLMVGLGRDPRATALVTAMIELVHALGLPAVAEGVETSLQHDLLVAVGCDQAQGLLYAAPAPALAAAAYLRAAPEQPHPGPAHAQLPDDRARSP